MIIEPGQLWYDMGGRHFLMILGRPPDDEHYWKILVYFPSPDNKFFVITSDPREQLENYCARVA